MSQRLHFHYVLQLWIRWVLLLVREAQLRREWCSFGSGWNEYDAEGMGLARCGVELQSAAESRRKYEKLGREELGREELGRLLVSKSEGPATRLAFEERRAGYHAHTISIQCRR